MCLCMCVSFKEEESLCYVNPCAPFFPCVPLIKRGYTLIQLYCLVLKTSENQVVSGCIVYLDDVVIYNNTWERSC